MKIGIVGLAIGGLLSGCTTAEETVKPKEVKTEAPIQKEQTKEEKAFGEWIVETKEMLSKQSKDPLLEQSGNDEGFNMYLNARDYNDLQIPKLQKGTKYGKDKDINNLWVLSTFVTHMQFSRTSHLGHIGQAMEKAERAKDWEETPEEMRQAYEYMNQILHDLDTAVNRDGKGETYGVTYRLNGDKVDEMEAFIKGDGE